MTSPSQAYEAFYRDFDSPIMRRIRREAYGEDIGQHSWVRADELRADVRRLALSNSSRLLDIGCGPCGPLTFTLASTGCHGTGVDLSPAALRNGCRRAASLGVDARLSVLEADLDRPLPFPSGSFDAAISFDVVLHLRDRGKLFAEVARVLTPGGRFLFTDAGVVTGPISSDEVRKRGVRGYIQLVPPGWNERLLEAAGFLVMETENRTRSVLENALGRLTAMDTYRAELEQLSSASSGLEGERDYLEAVVELSRREALSRILYLAARLQHQPSIPSTGKVF